GAAGNIGTDDLVHLLHREGVATGVDVEALTAVREPLISAVGHGLTSSLSDIPATPAVLDDRFAPTGGTACHRSPVRSRQRTHRHRPTSRCRSRASASSSSPTWSWAPAAG